MIFSRSVSGYDPLFVQTETTARLQKFRALEEAQTSAIEEVLKQSYEIETQLDIFKSQLESARGSSGLTEKYRENFGSNLLRKVEGQVNQEVQDMINETEIFEKEISGEVSALDTEIDLIKRDIRSVIKVIEDIVEINGFSGSSREDRIREIDVLIDHYAAKIPTAMPAGKLVALHKDSLLLQTPLFEDRPQDKEMAQVALADHKVTTKHTDKRPSEQSPAALAKFEPAGLSAYFGKSPSVLIAENDEDTANLLRSLFEKEGFQVKYAADGYQAVKFVHSGPQPDLVVLNMLLPYIDGLQLIKQIRRKKGWSNVQIIGLTVSYNEQDTTEIFESGANDCVTKPFNPSDLIARISRLANSLHNPQLVS